MDSSLEFTARNYLSRFGKGMSGNGTNDRPLPYHLMPTLILCTKRYTRNVRRGWPCGPFVCVENNQGSLNRQILRSYDHGSIISLDFRKIFEIKRNLLYPACMQVEGYTPLLRTRCSLAVDPHWTILVVVIFLMFEDFRTLHKIKAP